MIPLSIIVDPVGGWLALAFIAVFLVKLILAVFGGDVDADTDADVDVDVNTDGFGFSASDIFSLKGFLNFGVGFTSYWALFGLKDWNALGAVAVGLLTLFLLLWAYRACMKLEEPISHEKPQDLLHRDGTVYGITGNTLVVQVPLDGRIAEVYVMPDSGYTLSDFKAGDRVTITDVLADSDVLVRLYCTPLNDVIHSENE